jgi:mannose-6-phosphate isomerase-like protein (cupin superfamily)
MLEALLPVNLESAFDQIKEYWSPQIIAEVNDNYVKIAKIKGEFVWHDHENEDELFYIIKGSLEIELKGRIIYLGKGEMFVVPKAIMHKPHAREECWVMLVEPKSTTHTGKVNTPFTKSIEDQLNGPSNKSLD